MTLALQSSKLTRWDGKEVLLSLWMPYVPPGLDEFLARQVFAEIE